MFEPLPQDFSFPQAEERMLAFWEQHQIFEKSLQQRQGAPRFVFYEGPPTANGLPHPGHCLTRAIKDLFPRYQTMCGRLVERKAGWDTHGLPVEVEVCKELGIHTKEEIEAYGVEKFNKKCIESVFRYTREWEYLTKRLGFWVNLEDAYVTFHQPYVESVWWSLKTLFERGLLYQGHKVVWWWAQGGTALSAGEVGEGYRTVQDPSVYVKFPLKRNPEHKHVAAMSAQGRADYLWRFVEHAEETAQFLSRGPNEPSQANDHLASLRLLALMPPLLHTDEDDDGLSLLRGVRALGRERFEKILHPTSLLVWTTTPWTLISNHFAAVSPDVEYALVYDAQPGECYYMAAALVEAVAQKIRRELEVLVTGKGSRLIGELYAPPFDCYSSRVGTQPPPKLKEGAADSIAWRVVPAGFVELSTGTGIVHIAPAYGEVDFNLLQEERKRFVDELGSIPLLNAVAPNGNFNDDAPAAYRGRWVKDCDKDIIRELKERGILLHQETIEHEYPFCPRAENDALIQYARKSWFVRTSQFKDAFLANNAQIKWLPDHIQEGRFGDFLRNNVDWALSRERYWGTPLPIWVCEQTGRMEAIGSLTELMAKPGATDVTPEYPQGLWAAKKAEDPTLPDHLRVHKPYIDAWTYDSPFATPGSAGVSPARMHRVPEVIDCWWDAGSMPFAQWGYPHAPGSQQTFAQRFPADFISEAIDQTRGWFYGLLSISTLLFRDGIPTSGSAGVSPASPHAVGPRFEERRRRRIPHWEAGGCTYFVTFSTATEEAPDKRGTLSPEERTIVLEACRHWDGQRIVLHAVAVMPDHVHLLFTPLEQTPGTWWGLADLLHSIKGFSAKQINCSRGTKGSVWQPEYYDRIIRSESDYAEKWNYIVENPERAGLTDAYPWLWVEDETRPPQSGRDARAPQMGDDARLAQSGRDARAPLQGPDGHLANGGQDARAPRVGRSPREPGSDRGENHDFPHPYRTCIVLGHMMGEDGNKMSKRLRNYKEPRFVFDHYGADAMRWYFFSAQVPWTSTRFVEANIRDAHREFLVKLYHVLSFFNIYANIDGFVAHPQQGSPWRPTQQRGELDRWIISELHRTIRFVREKLDAFENYPAAQRLGEFVDALSNWYVRRSRDRFWRAAQPQNAQSNADAPQISQLDADLNSNRRKSAQSVDSPSLSVESADQDKWDAYHTLFGVLWTLSPLIAPFTPFFAEVMYQNLASGIPAGGTKGADEGATAPDAIPQSPNPSIPISVHLCDYPRADEALIDEGLVQEMDLVRDIVSLGRAARTAAKLKVRQPLALAEIILARPEHAAWLRSHAELIAEELNIKAVEFSTAADHYVSYQIKPNFKSLGPKFGKLGKEIAAALQTLDAAGARASLTSSGTVSVTVGGQTHQLTGDDVEVRLEAKPGWSAAQGRAGVVVVKTELSPELLDEGKIRELIHHVQGIRKDLNLAYETRIALTVETDAELAALVQRYAGFIQQECLAKAVTCGPIAGGEVREVKVEGHATKLSVA